MGILDLPVLHFVERPRVNQKAIEEGFHVWDQRREAEQRKHIRSERGISYGVWLAEGAEKGGCGGRPDASGRGCRSNILPKLLSVFRLLGQGEQQFGSQASDLRPSGLLNVSTAPRCERSMLRAAEGDGYCR